MKKWIIGGVLLSTLGATLALVRPAHEPKPELRIVGMVVKDGMDSYELEFSNPTTHEVTYLGYGATEPDWECKLWQNGRWEGPGGFRCGTGLSQHSLAAGGKMRFTVRRPQDADMQVGVLARPRDFEYGWVIKFDWLPEKVGAWLVDWQQERNGKRWQELIAWAPPLEAAPMAPEELAASEALEAGVVMDLANQLEIDPYAAGPPAPPDPNAVDPFGSGPAPAGADPFAPKSP